MNQGVRSGLLCMLLVGVVGAQTPIAPRDVSVSGSTLHYLEAARERFRSKKQFLGYAGRYARRPPIAQHRFRTISRQEIRFCDEGHAHQTHRRDCVHPGRVPGHARRPRPRPLPAQRALLRAARASREVPHTRCRLRAPGAGKGWGSRGDCGGRHPCRKASASIRSWTAMASGCVGLVASHRHQLVQSRPWNRLSRQTDPLASLSELIRCARARTPPCGLHPSPFRDLTFPPPGLWARPAHSACLRRIVPRGSKGRVMRLQLNPHWSTIPGSCPSPPGMSF